MKLQVEEKMLNAMELFYYSYRFKDSLFVVYLDSFSDMDLILTDLRVLELANIRVVIITHEDKEVERKVYTLKDMGKKYSYIRVDKDKIIEDDFISELEENFLKNFITPILSIKLKEEEKLRIMENCILFTKKIRAKKLFYLSSFKGLEVDNEFKSYPLKNEIDLFLKENRHINIGKDFLNLIYSNQRESDVEVVLLEAKAANIFQEVFTHKGKGTLFSTQYENIIRQANVYDIEDILIIMRPYIKEGVVLDLSEREILKEISSFYVFTVNGAIVAFSRLKDYGNGVSELGKFCTLPRYQGRGRARKLAKHLIKVAKKDGKRALFALSTQPRMWVFFLKLGFIPVKRSKLPQVWQKKYDFSRNSKALMLDLTPK